LHKVSAYHFDGAGKYFRPMVVLLTAKACNLHGTLLSAGYVLYSCTVDATSCFCLCIGAV